MAPDERSPAAGAPGAQGSDTGQPLDGGVRSEMERAFHADLGSVRLHRGTAVSRAADALSAVAFTEGDQVYVGSDAPALDSAAGRRLLSHELAHVLQQRRAGGVREERVGHRGDAFERAADSAAGQVIRGESALVAAPAGVPAIQAETKGIGMAEPDLPFRAQVEKAITTFLKRALKEQGGRSLEITAAVAHAMKTLANADDPRKGKPDLGKAMRMSAVEALLGGSRRPGDPAGLAKAIAALLPNPFDKEALDRLETLPASVAPPKGAEGIVELVRRKMPAPPNVPQQPSGGAPQDISEKNRTIEAGAIGERTLPVFHTLGTDVAQGLSGALKGRFERTGPGPAPDEVEADAAGPDRIQPDRIEPDRAQPGKASAKDAAPADRAPSAGVGNNPLPSPLFELSTSFPTVLEDFTPGSAALKPFHKTQLSTMVEIFLSRPHPEMVTEIEIVGHADTSGAEASNGVVAQQRAAAVKKHLVGALKVAEFKIQAVGGAGELEPVPKGGNNLARARNRSVEVIVRSRAAPRRKSPFGGP